MTRTSNQENVGLTVSNGHAGVKVRRLVTNQMAYRSGVRVNDVITHVNSIRVSDHASVITIVDSAWAHNIPVILHIRRPRRGLRGCLVAW